jgi:hypothetical protein
VRSVRAVLPVVIQLDQPTDAEQADVAAVLDQYRRHYGQPIVAGQALLTAAREHCRGKAST